MQMKIKFHSILLCISFTCFIIGVTVKINAEDATGHYGKTNSEDSKKSTNKITIISEGMCQAITVLGENSSDTERYAADELIAALTKMSGTEFTKSSGEIKVYIGTPVSCQEIKHNSKQLELNLPGERIAVRVIDGSLFLAGSTPSAALYATYTFLNHLGVRWFWPGETGEFIPHLKTVEVDSGLDLREKPAFRYRGLHIIPQSNPDTEVWMSRNRMNYIRSSPNREIIDSRRKLGFIITVAGHSVAPVEKDFAGHSQWYALLGDQRRTDLRRPHACWSNPEVRAYFAERTINHMDKLNIDLYQLYPTDSQTYCECDACTREDRCTTWHRFLSDVVSRIRKKHPESKLGTLAYQGYLPIPNCDVKYLDYLEFCMYGRCYRHLFAENCSVNHNELELLKKWISTGVPVTVRGYEFDVFNPAMPLPLAYLMHDQMRKFREIGVEGYFTESGAAGTTKFDGARLAWYVLARSSWNPDEPYEQIVSDWCATAFGPAAEPMKRYYQLFEKAWRDIPGDISYYSHTPGPTVHKLLNDAKIQQAYTFFYDAIKKSETVSNQTEQQRLIKLISFERAQFSLWVDLYRSAASVRTGIPVEAPKLSLDSVVPSLKSLAKTAVWDDAGRFPDFFDKDNRQPENKTEVRIFHTDKAVYLRVICHDKHIDRLQPICFKHDGPVYSDESIELFIRIPDQAPGEYYHLVVNSSGTRYDSVGKGGMKFDLKWNPVWNAKIQKLNNRWICDIELPFSEFGGKPQLVSDWQFSIKRTRGKRDDLEHSGFPDASFHNPDAFGILRFVNQITPGIAMYLQGVSGGTLAEELSQQLQTAPVFVHTPEELQHLLKGRNIRTLFIRINKRSESLSDKFFRDVVTPWVERGGILIISTASTVAPDVWFKDNSLRLSRRGGMLPDIYIEDDNPVWSRAPNDLRPILTKNKAPDGAFVVNESAWRILARSSSPDGQRLPWLLTMVRGQGNVILTSAGMGYSGGMQAFGSDAAAAALFLSNLEAFVTGVSAKKIAAQSAKH